MFARTFSTLLAVGALTCAQAEAGVITGIIVDSQGNPVRNALFEIDEQGGDGPTSVLGGMTDAQGAFTTTITPDGDYSIRIYPLSPPASLAVVTQLQDVHIGPTIHDMGTITLPVGVWATGRVVNTVGTPLVAVGLHFVTAPDFQPLDFTNHDTNAHGRFSVTVPYGESEMQFEPGPVPYYGGPGAAPTSLSLNVTSSNPIDLGDIVMPNGVGVSGTVRRQSDNSPVVDIEFQWVNRSTGKVMYVPHARTNEFGSFAFVSQLGNFDLRVSPDPNDGLMAKTVSNITVPGGQPGIVLLAEGVVLEGRVRGTNNANLANVAVTVLDHATQNPVFVGNVQTNVDGRYETIVPPGVYDVRFSPPFSLPYAMDVVTNVVVTSDKTVDSHPAALAFFTSSGAGTAGSGGFTPVISANGGTPRVGNGSYSVSVSQGLGSAPAFALLSQTWESSAGQLEGVMARRSYRRLSLGGHWNLPGAGVGGLNIPIANDAGQIGRSLEVRVFVRDPAAPSGWSTTSVLTATVQP